MEKWNVKNCLLTPAFQFVLLPFQPHFWYEDLFIPKNRRVQSKAKSGSISNLIFGKINKSDLIQRIFIAPRCLKEVKS